MRVLLSLAMISWLGPAAPVAVLWAWWGFAGAASSIDLMTANGQKLQGGEGQLKGPDGKPVTRGGGYADKAGDLECSVRAPQVPAWNRSDPQVPKSKWWLSDGPFVGFRVGLVFGR